MAILQNDHNVYILGAGFSTDAGFPVVSNFMDTMRDAGVWLQDHRDGSAEMAAIRNVLEFRRLAASAAYRINLDLENIEQLFSLASANEVTDTPGSLRVADGPEGMTAHVTWAIAATLDYATETAARRTCLLPTQYAGTPVAIPSSWVPSTRYPKFYELDPYELYLTILTGCLGGRRQSQRDTFITFNYDMVLEAALRRIGVEFSYKLPPASTDYDSTASWIGNADKLSVSVLKLHGSVNWAAYSLENDRNPGHRRVATPSVREPIQTRPASYRTTVYGDYGSLRDAGAMPFLAPPTWQKMLADVLRAPWEAAVSALQTATNLIIIGYSIPTADQHFKYLLGAGLQENVSLRKVFFVNPDRERLENQISSVFNAHRVRIEPTSSLNLASFLFDPTMRAEISRKLPGFFEYAQPSFLS